MFSELRLLYFTFTDTSNIFGGLKRYLPIHVNRSELSLLFLSYIYIWFSTIEFCFIFMSEGTSKESFMHGKFKEFNRDAITTQVGL